MKKTNQYRCTRPGVYGAGCPGHTDPTARQGHYIYADTEDEARQIMASRFPGEKIDVQLWAKAPTYAIYYAVEPDFFSSDHVTIAMVKSDAYKKVREIEASDLEAVYHNMQGEIWSPNGEARELIESLGLCHTSMSIGDVAEDLSTGKFYTVDRVGFRELI